jgi:hypothetical protein
MGHARAVDRSLLPLRYHPCTRVAAAAAVAALAALSACGGRTPLTDAFTGDGAAAFPDGGSPFPDGVTFIDGGQAFDQAVGRDANLGPDASVDLGVPTGPVQVDDHAGCTGGGGSGTDLCQKNQVCPVTLDVVLKCVGGADTVRVAAGMGERGYLSFGTVPGNRSQRLLTIDPAGGSNLEIVPLADGDLTAYVLADAQGQPSLAAEYPIEYAASGPGHWQFERVPPDDGSPYFFDGAIAPQGDVFILRSGSSNSNGTAQPLILATRSGGGMWTDTMVAESGYNGGVSVDATGQPIVATWEDVNGQPSLVAHEGNVVRVLSQGLPQAAILDLRVAVTGSSSGAVVASLTQEGSRLFISDLADAGVALTPPTPAALPSSQCNMPPAGGPCMTTTSCTERSADIVESSLGVATTGDGAVWAVYVWQQVDRDITYAPPPPPCHDGPCDCQMTVTQDRTTFTLIIATVTLEGADPAMVWSASLPGLAGVISPSLVARDSRLLVPLIVYPAAAPAEIRYLEIDTTRL